MEMGIVLEKDVFEMKFVGNERKQEMKELFVDR